jgi:Methyl-accepting chemotaxis protein-like, first PDC sensor domain
MGIIKVIATWRRAALTGFWIACAVTSLGATSAQSAGIDDAQQALVRLAADRIDAILREVAASTRAVGEEYRALAEQASPVTDADKADWAARRRVDGSTAGFRTWPRDTPEPAAQAPYAGIYDYGGVAVTEAAVAHLRDFESLLPVLRSAYRSFDFQWVYLTTADGMMVIYPYVPMGEAVNNAMPTQQVYYKAADFEHRAVGWTEPYLDLVGAGMMITASYPVYRADHLLGVASRDITLKQLSRSVLVHLARSGTVSAFLVDPHGLAIDASDPRLATEREQVNAAKKFAALYYRTPAGLATLGNREAVASRIDWVNQVTERVLDKAAHASTRDAIYLRVDGRKVLAARIESTGWFVVLVERKS